MVRKCNYMFVTNGSCTMTKSGSILRMVNDENAQESNPLSGASEEERVRWARKLKPARVAMKLKQQDVADMAGVSRNTVVSAEAGNKVPQADKLWRMMIALDLGPDPADSYPDWVHTWLAIFGPLIAKLPEEGRGEVLSSIVTTLGEAIMAGNQVRVTTGMSRDEVDRELKKAQRLGLVPNEDNVHPLTSKNQPTGLDPDGMPPWSDDMEILAARRVPDHMTSMRPKIEYPDEFPDENGPEDGA